MMFAASSQSISATALLQGSAELSRKCRRGQRAEEYPSFPGVAPAIAPNAQVGLLLVAPEALDRAEAAAIFADHGARLRGLDLLIGAGLQELADPETAGVTRRPLGRQRVVGADHLVAVGDVGLGPEEEGAVVLQALEILARFSRQHLDMLGGDTVGLGDHLVLVGAEDHLAIVAPGDTCD